jgi:glycine hydroxymethyltransferase
MLNYLKSADPEIYAAIRAETIRQHDQLEMIASENFASLAVIEAMGTTLTNKYAEGYPGKRYYGGCEHVDVAENLALERVKRLFGVEYANVQPHSGASANTAVFYALLQPGDTILGMDLAQGGHLTHGFERNLSGKWFKAVSYGLDPKTERIDYAKLEELAQSARPKLIIAGASAYPREIDFERFAAIAKNCGAKLMVDMAHIAGLVATGIHPSPVPHADVITSTTHKTLRGPRGGLILARVEYGKALDSAIIPGTQGGPLMHVIAAKAVAFKEALEPAFTTYAKQIVANAQVLASELAGRGLRLVTGGTDNHLMLADLRPKQITGKDASALLHKVGITVNKNLIPNDPEKPLVTSGIRIGTPALTTRGMREEEMTVIARVIGEALEHRDDKAKLKALRATTEELCARFPLYPEWRVE